MVYAARNWSTTITGSTDAYFRTGNWRLASGRLFSDAEERAGKAVCVIGETVCCEMFGRQSPVGSAIRIKQFACEVIGLLISSTQGSTCSPSCSRGGHWRHLRLRPGTPGGAAGHD
jgi:putative ABC transport system permease protein